MSKREAWPSHPAASTCTTSFLLHNWVPTASNCFSCTFICMNICTCICIHTCIYCHWSCTTESFTKEFFINCQYLVWVIWASQLYNIYTTKQQQAHFHISKLSEMRSWNWTQFCEFKLIFLIFLGLGSLF